MTYIFNTLKKSDKHTSFHAPDRAQSQTLFLKVFVTFLIVFAIGFDAGAAAKEKTVATLMEDLQKTIKTRKWNWDLSVFTEHGWQTRGHSVQGYPMIYYTCGDSKNQNKGLILSNVHGDEVTPGFFGFRLVEWLKARQHLCKDRFIVIAPMVNPDGFMRYSKGTRTNFNKVDLNRNFDTPDWNDKALKIWKEKFKSRRYYPGDKAASEPEVMFQKWLIDEFAPTKILSIHAPLNFLDYDGPQSEESALFTKTYVEACEELKSAVKKATPKLDFYAYGVFPGSLGNYAGKQRGIPTFTVELPTTKQEYAAKYFSDLEEGTALFIEYELKEYKSVKAATK